MAPQPQIRPTGQPAASIGAHLRTDPGGAAALPGGPDHPLHGHQLLLALGHPSHQQPVAAHLHHLGAGADPHIAALQAELGLLTVEGAGAGQEGVALFDQFHHRLARRQVGEFAGQFHTGRAASHHREALQGTARAGEVAHQILQPLHIGEAAEAETMAVRPGDAERVGACPGGQHQALPGNTPPRLGVEATGRQVDPQHPVLQPGNPPAGEKAVVAGGDFPAPQFTAE